MEDIDDITKEIEDDNEDSFVKYDINSYPAFYTLETISKYYDVDSNVFIIPAFQRNPIWDDRRQSLLIESFLIGLPVPPIFLFTETGGQFKVVDGLQRIHSVHSFLNNKLKLKGLNSESPYSNKYFKDLDEETQNRLNNVVLPATVIRQSQPNDDSSIYKIFERLNTGGEKLNNMEVRRCIAYGDFLKQLETVNNDIAWKKILAPSESVTKRFLDLELVLRCFALYDEKYTSPMKEYLNNYMEKNKNTDKSDVAERFVTAVQKIEEDLGEKPFHTDNNRANYAILDSVIVNLMKNPDVENLEEKIKTLKEDKNNQLIIFSGQGTMSTKSVHDRLQYVHDLFFE